MTSHPRQEQFGVFWRAMREGGVPPRASMRPGHHAAHDEELIDKTEIARRLSLDGVAPLGESDRTPRMLNQRWNGQSPAARPGCPEEP